jgi:NitT/TauT family transport system ATP-binding protein
VEEAILLGNRVIVLSARPGRVIGDFAVPFDRPRSHSLRTSPEFGELEAAIWALLRREIAVPVPVPAPVR